MKIKKTLSLILAALLIMAIFAGCGTAASGSVSKSPESGSGSSLAAESSGTVSAPAETGNAGDGPENMYPLCDELTELSLFCVYMPDFMSDGLVDTIEEFAFVDYLEELTNVHINFDVVGSVMTYMEQVSFMVAGGDMRDMITGVNGYPGGALNGIENGELVNVYPYLEECAPDYWRHLNESKLNLMMSTLDTGVMGAVYLLRENGGATNGLAVRQDWLDELNMEAPTTYAQFEDMLTRFKTEYDCASPFVLTKELQAGSALTGGYGTSGLTTGQNTQQYMLSYYQVDGQVHFSPLEEGYKKYIDMLHRWYENGLISNDFVSVSVEDDEASAAFYRGDSGATYIRGDAVDSYIANMTDDTAVLGGLQFPVENEGDTYHFVDTHYISQNTTIAITTACENVELALKWMNVFFTDEYKYALNFDTEGKTYELVDGKVQLTDVILKNDMNVAPKSALSTYSACGKMFPILETDAYETVLMSDAEKDIRAKATVGDDAYIIPIMSVLTEYLDEYNSLYSDISTYVMENSTRFVIGERDMSEWDAYMEELRKIGAERMLEIFQLTYDHAVSVIA